MSVPTSNRTAHIRLKEWIIDVGKTVPKLKPPEKIAIIFAVVISAGVIYENGVALFAYRPDISVWALIFDGDMAAGLFVVAIVAVGFEFWKLRKPPESVPPSITVQAHAVGSEAAPVQAPQYRGTGVSKETSTIDWGDQINRLKLLTDILGQWKPPAFGYILLGLGGSLFAAGSTLLYEFRPVGTYALYLPLDGILGLWGASVISFSCSLWIFSRFHGEYTAILRDYALPVATAGRPAKPLEPRKESKWNPLEWGR
jgi:hypothetical protein